MYIVESYTSAVILCVVTMICWGSWANTQKLAEKSWSFPLYYWDYTLGLILLTLIFGFTLGSTGDSGMPFLTSLQQASGFSSWFGLFRWRRVQYCQPAAGGGHRYRGHVHCLPDRNWDSAGAGRGGQLRGDASGGSGRSFHRGRFRHAGHHPRCTGLQKDIFRVSFNQRHSDLHGCGYTDGVLLQVCGCLHDD